MLLAALIATAACIAILPTDGTRHPPEFESADDGVPGKPNVVQFLTPWLAHGCGGGCWNAYLELVPDYGGHSHRADRREAPPSEREVFPALAPAALPSGELPQRIIDGLAIGSLLDGLPERRLAVAVLGESRSQDGVTRRRLL